MIRIEKASTAHSVLLASLAEQSFRESHSHSAAAEDIDYYVAWKLNIDTFEAELADVHNHFYILYYEGQAAGYSKIIFNQPIEQVAQKAITKLERIYLLKKYHGLQLGQALMQFNLNLMHQAHQVGVWLYTWTENHRAIAFYQNLGFEIIGSGDFKISKTHYNPNHLMYLSL